MLVAGIHAIQFAQQRRPYERSTEPIGLHLYRLLDAVQDLRVHRREFAASLGADLDLAGALEDIHGKKCIGNRSADGQQAVIAQYQKVPVAKIGLQPRFLVVAECDSLVIMVSERREDKSRLLRNRQYAALLG